MNITGNNDVICEEPGDKTVRVLPRRDDDQGGPVGFGHDSPWTELSPGSALLVVKRGPNAGTQFRLTKAMTSVGRHPNSDIFLDEIAVSRRHAEFRRDGNEVRIVDLGSLNSTYVNRQVVDSAVLTSGDEVQIGKFRLLFFCSQTVASERARLGVDFRQSELQST
jgi:pSer/pThr/pTyr-binding forkhead associated (FHA) protein